MAVHGPDALMSSEILAGPDVAHAHTPNILLRACPNTPSVHALDALVSSANSAEAGGHGNGLSKCWGEQLSSRCLNPLASRWTRGPRRVTLHAGGPRTPAEKRL